MSKQKIAEASAILALGTIAANLLQIVKLIIVSAWFGASTGLLDQYFIALNIPLAFQGVVMGALQASFIPLYVGHAAKGESLQAQQMLRNTFGFGIWFYLLLCLALALLARPILHIMAGGFGGEEFELNVVLFRIMLVMLLLNGLCDLVTAFYNANKRYFLPAAAPVLAIFISIIYLIVFRNQGVYALAYGLIVGAVFQFLVLVAGARRWGDFELGISHGFLSPAFRAIYKMMLPIAGGLMLAHAILLTDQAVATRLTEGSVSTLNYALRLHDVVVKIFILSVGGALLPFLSQYVAERKISELRSTLAVGQRLALLTVVPMAIFIWFFGAETIAAVFQRRLFMATDSAQVGFVWGIYSLGLFFVAASIFASRALNAMKDLHPLWISAAVAIPLNLVLDIWFSRMWGVPGIAAATAFVYFTYLMIYHARLGRTFEREGAERPLLSPAWKSAAAVGLLGIVCLAADRLLGGWLQIPENLDPADRARILGLILAVAVAASVSYIAALRMLKVSEAAMLLQFVTRILRRSSSAPPPAPNI